MEGRRWRPARRRAGACISSAAQKVRAMYQKEARRYPTFLSTLEIARRSRRTRHLCMPHRDHAGLPLWRCARSLRGSSSRPGSVGAQRGSVCSPPAHRAPALSKAQRLSPSRNFRRRSTWCTIGPSLGQRFDAGGVTVHNTDSVMCRFPGVPPTVEGMRKCIELGTEAARITLVFQDDPEKPRIRGSEVALHHLREEEATSPHL